MCCAYSRSSVGFLSTYSEQLGRSEAVIFPISGACQHYKQCELHRILDQKIPVLSPLEVEEEYGHHRGRERVEEYAGLNHCQVMGRWTLGH